MTGFKAGLTTLDHYLDDFIFAGNSETQDCAVIMSKFIYLADDMGIPSAYGKTIGPLTSLTYLEFFIYTAEMVIRIPQHKVVALHQAIQYFLYKDKVTLKELQLGGTLIFFSKANRFNRAFTRRFYDAKIEPFKPFHHIRLISDMKKTFEFGYFFLFNLMV